MGGEASKGCDHADFLASPNGAVEVCVKCGAVCWWDDEEWREPSGAMTLAVSEIRRLRAMVKASSE